MLADAFLGIIAALGLVLATNAVFVADWPRFFVSIIMAVICGTWLLRRILLNSKAAAQLEAVQTEAAK
jgi:hypothetical protein